MREFTPEELGRFNGRGGAPAYVAFKGKVYDVSKSWHFRNGEHWTIDDAAGRDLTAEFDSAPHGEELLNKFPVVGILSDG